MKKGKRVKNIARSIRTGIFTVFLFVLFYAGINKNNSPVMLITREVFPVYFQDADFSLNRYAYSEYLSETPDTIISTNIPEENMPEIVPGGSNENKQDNPASIIEKNDGLTELIGINNVIYQPGTDMNINNNSQIDILTSVDIDKLKDLNFLKNTLYTIDKRTNLIEGDIDVEDFLQRDFRLNREVEGPKLLIIHTHSQESFKDSKKGDLNDGIFAVGDKLAEVLQTKYNIESLHDKSSYDIVDGRSSTLGAYERMEKSVIKILETNPTIETVIDLHRDGVSNDNIRFVTNINGKDTAKIMFFNGICRVYKNGVLGPTEGLSSPYVKDNLALSFKLQLLANELYPGFTRKVYVNAYRYSLHFKPKSLLIEVGAQTNTKQEALNVVEPLAEILAKIL